MKCVPGACEGQKMMSDPKELKLQIVVNNHMSVGNRSRVLWKNRQCLNQLSHLSSPRKTSFNLVILCVNPKVTTETVHSMRYTQ